MNILLLCKYIPQNVSCLGYVCRQPNVTLSDGKNFRVHVSSDLTKLRKNGTKHSPKKLSERNTKLTMTSCPATNSVVSNHSLFCLEKSILIGFDTATKTQTISQMFGPAVIVSKLQLIAANQKRLVKFCYKLPDDRFFYKLSFIPMISAITMLFNLRCL